MFIRSGRLFLRPAFPEDSRELHEAICNAGIVSMLASAPWPYLRQDAEAFCAAPVDPLAPRFVITLPGAKGAPIIGTVGFKRAEGGLEMGYWIARDHWGRGYATEAGRAALDVVRALGHRRVQAGHYLDNPASGRVLRKLGFRETGEISPTFSRARGGELVLARRYGIEFDAAESDGEVADQRDRMRAA
jgi:RimJ/RimL family protein N-acetyltransferase